VTSDWKREADGIFEDLLLTMDFQNEVLNAFTGGTGPIALDQIAATEWFKEAQSRFLASRDAVVSFNDRFNPGSTRSKDATRFHVMYSSLFRMLQSIFTVYTIIRLVGGVDDDEILKFLGDTHTRANNAFSLNCSFVRSYRDAPNRTMLEMVEDSKELDVLQESVDSSRKQIDEWLKAAERTIR
jgi:hypothetical protein